MNLFIAFCKEPILELITKNYHKRATWGYFVTTKQLVSGVEFRENSLESLGGDSLHSSEAKEPAAPSITLDLVKKVTMPGGARNYMNLKLRKCYIAKM